MNLGHGTFRADVGDIAVDRRTERRTRGSGRDDLFEGGESAVTETLRLGEQEWDNALQGSSHLHTGWTRVSPWSASRAKRVFDCVCVLIALPLLIPVMLVIGLAVRLTSSGPVLFTQARTGRHGKTFIILKFRTMIHVPDKKHHAVTTAVNQPFTPIGPFLRRWKMDELPQVLNVLAGHMSLVGPRPKLPEHLVQDLPCRPGITGAATVAFAREEGALAQVPQHKVNDYYHALVLPAKRHLDALYMGQATFVSDLKLIFKTLLRRWDDSVLEDLLAPENLRRHAATHSPTFTLEGSTLPTCRYNPAPSHLLQPKAPDLSDRNPGSASETLAIKAERQRRRELEESANGIRAAHRPLLVPTATRKWACQSGVEYPLEYLFDWLDPKSQRAQKLEIE